MTSSIASVSGLRVAPVKALASVLRERVRLEPDGVAEDRRLFLLRADGSVATQREIPQLVRVVPDLDLPAGKLTVAFPDGSCAAAALTPVGEPLRSRLFGRDRVGRLVPGDVAAALSTYAGEPLRLALADRTGTGWDEGPVSLLGRASADAVDPPEVPHQSRTARFRMLVEVDGTTAYEEDSWVGSELRIGQAVLHVTKPLGRCVVVNLSPETGEKDWAGLRSLVAVRGRTDLGVIAEVRRSGEIHVGDAVEVS